MRYRIINGHTKESMKAAIRRGNKGERAVNKEANSCVYLTHDGNKCAVGCFIPDGHTSQRIFAIASSLTRGYPDLLQHMPLEAQGLDEFQKCHDHYQIVSALTLHETLFQWIDNNTYEEGETK